MRAREEAVLDAVEGGQALPIVWAEVQARCNGHTGTLWVAADTLRFGVPGPNADPNDWDWVRVAVTPITAQRIADQLGVLLPTDKILDLAYAQADVRLRAHIQRPVTATVLGMLAHHAAIEAERAGREGLISTIGKDWILGNEMSPSPGGGPPAHPLGYDGAINYGWHVEPTPAILARIARHRACPEEPYGGPYEAQPGIVVWQTRGLRHNRHHVDYSQWIPRLVAPWMMVDGKRVSTAEVMQSPELAGLVSYQGPLQSVRLPDPPRNGPRGTDPSGTGQNRSASRPAHDSAEIDAGAPGNGTGAGLRVQAPQAPYPGAVFKVIDLGNHALRFGNSFPDATFLGIHFPGLCGGMSAATLDYFFSGLPAPTTTTTPSTHDTLGAYIKARQVDSLTGWHLARFAAMIANPSDVWIAAQTAGSFEELKQSIDAGKPVLLGLIPAPWSLDPSEATNAHQVVGHGYAINEAGGKTVMILDPNRPLLNGNYLHQAPGTLQWIEPPLRGVAQEAWRGFFVESGYRPQFPPSDDDEPVAENDAGEAGAAVDMLGTGIATVAGAAGGERVGKEAATGAGIGAAVGAVLEAVPVVGPALHAIAVAAGAIGGAISGALRDTFRPSPLQAGIFLLLCHVAPGMIFAGLDKITTDIDNAEAFACYLARYLRLVAGIVPNHWPLYNPRDRDSRSNPYIESPNPDPEEPLTDVRFTRHIKNLVIHFGHQPAARGIPPMIRTKADAQGILQLLRSRLAESGVLSWDAVRGNLPGLRVAIAKVRALAGEAGPDPVLAALVGGSVAPPPARQAMRATPPPHFVLHRPLRQQRPLAAQRRRPLRLHLAAALPAHTLNQAGLVVDGTRGQIGETTMTTSSQHDPFRALHASVGGRPASHDPFADLSPDAGAPAGPGPIGVGPETALEQLLTQIDRRFPFRGKGPLDGIRDDVLRITGDPGRIGRLPSGPDLAALQAAVLADVRTLHTDFIADRGSARYLVVVVKPSRTHDTSMWDLDRLDLGDASAADTGGLFDAIKDALAEERIAERRYLRDKLGSDSFLGRVLNLDQPDEPKEAPAPPPMPAPPRQQPSRGWGTPPHVTLVPEASGVEAGAGREGAEPVTTADPFAELNRVED